MNPQIKTLHTGGLLPAFLQYGGVLDVVRAKTAGQLSASDDNVTSPYTLNIGSESDYEANYFEAVANPFHWAARDVGAQANGINVAVIDKGADLILTLDGAPTTVTVGTQLVTASGSPNGAKSAYIYAWDAANNKASVITSDTWIAGTGGDVIENGVTDLNITAVGEWYDEQTVFSGLKWNSVAPRPGTSPYVADRSGANDEMHIVVFDKTGSVTGSPNTVLEKFLYVSKSNNAKTSEGAQNYYPQVVLERGQLCLLG